MCTFEILSPRIDIVNYLVPRWHVSSTSCNLLVFGVKMMSDILAIYHRELFPNTSCLLTIGTHLCGRNYWSSLHWLLPLFDFSLAKECINSLCLPYHLWILFISWSCLVFSRYSESGDPTLCILYSNANSLQCTMLGGAILFFLERSPCDPFQVCVGGMQIVSFGTLCHHETL